MARRKGMPMFGKKSVQGSYYITRVAYLKMRAARKRSGKSDSDIIDYCLRESADGLTREKAEALSGETEPAAQEAQAPT
jgi:hypothetical protein